MAMPGCLRHITRSGWCFAMVIVGFYSFFDEINLNNVDINHL